MKHFVIILMVLLCSCTALQKEQFKDKVKERVQKRVKSVKKVAKVFVKVGKVVLKVSKKTAIKLLKQRIIEKYGENPKVREALQEYHIEKQKLGIDSDDDDSILFEEEVKQ